MADTSLIFKIIARDHTQGVMAKLKRTAENTGSFVAKALGGPALLPVLASAGTAVMGFGVALGAAGAAAGVFGAVTGSAMGDVNEAATKVEGLRDKMALYGREAQLAAAAGQDNAKYLKKQADASLELQARLANLPPETRNATMAYIGMKDSWDKFVDKNKPGVFGLIGRGYKLLETSIGKLQPLFDIGKAAASRLLSALERVVAGGFIERLAARARPAMDSLWRIIVNVTTALGNMFGRSAAGGQGMLDWIERMTGKWATWAKSTDSDSGFSRFLAYAQQNGPAVLALLGNLATAAVHIAQAVAPLAPISLAIASGLASLIAAIPPNVITALVAGFIAFQGAMKILAVVEGVLTVATWMMNSAFWASPITWIVAAIIVAIAVIVLLATKTQFFQTIWRGVWGFLKAVGAWFAGPFANFFVAAWHMIVSVFVSQKNSLLLAVNQIKNFFIGLGHGIASVWNGVTSRISQFISFIGRLPGKVRGALSNMFSPLWSGFKGIVNRIIGGWNNLSFTIGGGSFMGINVPSASFGTPNIPYLASGGDIQRTGLAVVHRGERISKAAVARRTGPGAGSGGGGGGATIHITGGEAKVVRILLELLRDGIRDQGGDPVKVLTPR